MKTIVVTGGLGFIGSHFVELALQQGYRVHNVDMVTYASNPTVFSPHPQNYSYEKVDIKDLKELPHCDYIVNFAAESHVDRSIENSDPFMNSNVIGVYNILELLKNKKMEHMRLGWEYKDPTFIYIGTDEVFGDIEKGFFKEEDRHNPSNPYSASKSCAEMLVKAWGRTYNLPYRITRTTNNYGERQHPEKLIPHCITQLLSDKPIRVHGTGEYVRNWIYVKDNCEAILKVMEKGEDGQSYHISSDEEYSVLQIVQMIANKLGKEPKDWITFVPNRSGQDVRYALNNEKIKRDLHWEQSHKLDKILTQIIESYKKEVSDEKLV